MNKSRLTRRQLLSTAGLAAAGILTSRNFGASFAMASVTKTINGGQHAGLTIPAGETWEFTGTVESTANVVVYGTLVMRPGSTLRFVGINEANVVGGGDDVLVSDVGLWVMGAGVLDIQGTWKTGWMRQSSHPWSGWLSTDELVTTPIAVGDYSTFAPIAMGATVPSFTREGVTYTAEVLNLTRDVNIEGTPTGRAHVFIRSTSPQTIKFATFRHMGPLAGDSGRYALHFHECEDASRGSIVESVVVRDCGAHAFVPHASHGITFERCIAFNVGDRAYWWDRAESRFTFPENASFDTTYSNCLAAKIYPREGVNAITVTGFFLGHGERNKCIGCVAVGVVGKKNASGFNWPEKAQGAWDFQNAISHNNRYDGAFIWQNGGGVHLIDGFTCYRNGEYGVEHGAYNNSYDYQGLVCFENGISPVLSHALGQPDLGQFWRARADGTGAPDLDASGKSYSLIITNHNIDRGRATTFQDARFRGYTVDAIQVNESSSNDNGRYDFIRCLNKAGGDVEASDVTITAMHPDSIYRFQRRNGTAYQLHPNGTTTTIPAFA